MTDDEQISDFLKSPTTWADMPDVDMMGLVDKLHEEMLRMVMVPWYFFPRLHTSILTPFEFGQGWNAASALAPQTDGDGDGA